MEISDCLVFNGSALLPVNRCFLTAGSPFFFFLPVATREQPFIDVPQRGAAAGPPDCGSSPSEEESERFGAAWPVSDWMRGGREANLIASHISDVFVMKSQFCFLFLFTRFLFSFFLFKKSPWFNWVFSINALRALLTLRSAHFPSELCADLSGFER